MTQPSELLWTPDADWIANANVTRFARWLAAERGLEFADYESLWAWSVDDLETFWAVIWDFFEIMSSAPWTKVLQSEAMPGAVWFPGARLNYAEHVLRRETPGRDALAFASETDEPKGMLWEDLAGQVRVLATRLRALGVAPGDRVVAYMPNIPQTVVAMLATTAIGAIWSSCSPDFGVQGVLDRFTQLRPKVLFCVGGYRYGGKLFDRRTDIRGIAARLDGLEHVVELAGHFPGEPFADGVSVHQWRDLLDNAPIAARAFRCEQMPFDAPLWILFSSGTTALPKPIVHSHGGIILEMHKCLAFHMNLHAGETAFFFTTTGWMMWNIVASMLMLGVRPLLYDGNPTYPDVSTLWRLADSCGAAFFGASPSYVDLLRKNRFVPKEHFVLASLRAIMPAGSPVSPACTAWFYENVKPDLWIATGSGGTDCCTGLVGGVPTLPVRAGEIQARQLGVAVHAFDEDGNSVIGEDGELVITRPMPSMPVFLWGDAGNTRYRETYFDTYPGVWRHGDLLRINARGGCFVLGRSDATLNRHGVRIGTAEIYRTLETLDEILDGLIVNLDLEDGGFFMPLFVKLRPGTSLDDALHARIGDTLRRAYTPRHVPDGIVAVPEIPYTITGKKMEIPVRRILMGAPPDAVLNRNAMANPSALEPFVAYAARRRGADPTPKPAAAGGRT